MNKKLLMGLATVGMVFALVVTAIVTSQKLDSKACQRKPSLTHDCDLIMEKNIYYFEGQRIEPEYKVMYMDKELKNGIDYYAKLEFNDRAGTATLKLQGQGDYVDSIRQDFIIKDLNATNKNGTIDFEKACTAELVGQDFYYDGKKSVCPEILVKYGNTVLQQNKDYTCRYVYNNSYGWAKCEVSGIGKFNGSIYVKYYIKKPNAGKSNKVDILNCEPKMEKKCHAYTGNAIKAKVIVTDEGSNKQLKENVDFKVSYSNNTKPGTAKVKITGIGEYTGSRKINFTIK